MTLTTVGYGDVVPITPLGRLVAAVVMICGLGVFGLWTGILATGFAAETRRDNFLKTWESVSKVPFFAALGPAAIADVTHMLRTMDLPARTMIIRKGQAGDCMYFIAAGEVEVDLPGKKVRLGEGAFFGEMALLGNNLRSANITTTRVSRLLVLDLVDFRHADGAASRSCRDDRRRSQAARAGEQIMPTHASGAADLASAPLLEIDGARATIRLNRPKHLNRLQPDDLDVLMKLFDRIEADPAIRVLVLTGTGRAFSAGYDLGSIAERAANAQEQTAGSAFEVVVNRLEDLAVPTICRLNGGVYGGSTDLALACDFRIGVDTCEMFMPAARLGLHYYKSGIQRYVSRLGVDNAKRLFLTAERIGAAEMLRIGYLTAMVPAEALDEEVDKLAAILAGNAPVAMRGMKRAINEIARGRLDEEGRRPPPSRQHAERRDQGRHQGVCGKAPAEVLVSMCYQGFRRARMHAMTKTAVRPTSEIVIGLMPQRLPMKMPMGMTMKQIIRSALTANLSRPARLRPRDSCCSGSGSSTAQDVRMLVVSFPHDDKEFWGG